MAAADYVFQTRWRVRATLDEIQALLGDAEALPRWWPSVYLRVSVLDPGRADGTDRVVSLYTKGWLPYTLRWSFRVTDVRAPRGFSLEAMGDFVGRGDWTFTADGDHTLIVYDWRIRAEKPLLRYGSLFMRPIFAANHRWAMARGLESLELELRRRRARDARERDAVPAPPGPTFV
jgi:hypothetical protein